MMKKADLPQSTMLCPICGRIITPRTCTRVLRYDDDNDTATPYACKPCERRLRHDGLTLVYHGDRGIVFAPLNEPPATT